MCVDAKSMRKSKKILNLFDLKTLDKFVKELSEGSASEIPPEIVVNLPEEQLANFTKPEVQKTVEKLRAMTTVSLNIKSRQAASSFSVLFGDC